MFMWMNIASNIKSALSKIESVKEFMKFVEEHSQTIDKYLAETLTSSLTTMKFDDSRIMHKHVIEMTNIATRLKYIGMIVEKNFLVQFILNVLLSEYIVLFKWTIIPWKINRMYILMKMSRLPT